MKRAAALLVVVATSVAFADDDPDLLVVSGKVVGEPGRPVSLQLDRHVSSKSSSRTEWGFRKSTVAQGAEFRFAGLPPGRYDLIVEGESIARDDRTIDVFDDVSGLEVRAVAAAPARLLGHITLGYGFAAALEDCSVNVGRTETRVGADGAFALPGLVAGDVWAIVVCDSPRSAGPDRRLLRVERRFPVVLKAGDNEMNARLTPNMDARVKVRSKRATESIEGTILDLDAGARSRRGAPFRVDMDEDYGAACFQIRYGGIDSAWWENVGWTLPLLGVGCGAHKIRIEALGFEPTEREFDVDATTRVDVELTPLPGGYVRMDSSLHPLYVDERRSDGTWAEVFTHDRRGLPTGAPPPAPTRVFLTPGVHVLRAATPDSPPSGPVELKVADNRAEVAAPTFALAKGATLTARLDTKSGAALDGFDVRVFRMDGERWDHLRAQDTFAAPGFTVAGLAKGAYRLAFDEDGKHVFAEFDMGAEDVEREFTFRCR